VKVFVTGGTGYVGVPVVRRLVACGHEVYVLQREETARPLREPGVHVVLGSLFAPDNWLSRLRECDAVIHLVGIIREVPREGVTMERIHVCGTRCIVDAAQAAGVSRFLHMSALGARDGAVSAYHKSKWDAERIVQSSPLNFTIFRPSVINGDGGPGPNFISLMTQLIKTAPLVPIIGDGHFELQPVAIETVSEAFVTALDTPVAYHNTYEIGGPERIAYRDILQRMALALNKPLRTVSVPVFAMKALIPVVEKLPGFPLTKDQLAMLLEGNVCEDPETVYQELHLEPIPFLLPYV
jgi:uncharacterized protein YbjT (DUF2867 family)